MQGRHSEQFSWLLKASMSGKLSRRDIVRRGTMLGLSAPMIGFVLQARGAAAQDATPAAAGEVGYSITIPEGIRTDLAGATISIIIGDEGAGYAFDQAVVAAFVEATGIQVNHIAGPQSATERFAQYQQLLGAEATDVDALMIDVIWPGSFAQHAVDLAPALAEQGNEYFERIVNNNTVNDVLVAIPWYTDAGLLYYRTDLGEQYGFEGPPATWAELTERAQAIQDGERANNPDFQGFVWQGGAYEGLTCNALEWQISHNGGEIVDQESAEVEMNTEGAAAAFELAKSWVGTISPEGVTGYMEEDSRGVWQGGNAAFMRNWPYAFSLGQAADSTIKDKFAVSLLPKGDVDGGVNADTLGGWQMMVSKYSENQEAAIEWAKFSTSVNIQKAYAIERSLLPTIPALYDDADVLAVNAFFAQLKDVFLGGAVARPSTVTGDLYNEVSTAYFTGVNQILTGQVDVAEGLEEMQSAIEEIVSEL